MYDIHFFRATKEIKDAVVAGRHGAADAVALGAALERARDSRPFVFNMETTNYCNMTCVMCPRTSLMTRQNIWIADEVFEKVLDQVRTHSQTELEDFWRYVGQTYHVSYEQPDENAFYFHVVSRCLILHGYGEPLLDKKIVERVRACSERRIPTYFSCVPANLTVERAEEVMKAGLSVLKFSMDGLSDEMQKRVRGKRNNFDASFRTILDIIELKREKGYQTLLVPTMIALSEDDEAKAMHREFLKLWEGRPVFAYVKSQDNRWYHEEDDTLSNRSHYESQYCEYPWTSLTVMADGSVVPCTQDYNVEMVLGNVLEQSLEEIWNGPAYADLRRWHVEGGFPAGHKCAERCDQKKICGYLKA
jgi:radical SAM protein with 4Fe4S-binding SPASM domain